MLFYALYEPRHDKTNKMSVRPAKTQISLGIRPVWSESSLSAWRKLWSLNAQRRLWSDWADAKADLSLRWAHTHFVGFVMSRLISELTDLSNLVLDFNHYYWKKNQDISAILKMSWNIKNHFLEEKKVRMKTYMKENMHFCVWLYCFISPKSNS